MSSRISLLEYQTSTVPLSVEDVRDIRTDARNPISITPSVYVGMFDLNPGPNVGVVRLPSGLTLDLLPKVKLFNVLWMIAEVEGLEGIDYKRLERQAMLRNFEDILEPIATAFAEQVDRLIERGLYRTYVEQEDNLTAIRGRIEFREDLNHNVVLRHRTWCRFTEFSWDVPENQVIRQVARKLAGWGFSRQLTSRLMAIERQLEDVQVSHFSAADIDRFHYSRQSEHYRGIHRYCALFLRGLSLSEGVGETPFDGFVMDMNVLFEQFVSMKLQQQFADSSWRMGRQQSFDLFREHGTKIRPDLLLSHHGARALVGDTKYKRREGADGGSDYYQMIAYCTVLGLDTAMLVYPRHETDVDQRLTVWGSDIRIHETSIDLSESREAIEREFQALAKRMIDVARVQVPMRAM